MVHKGQKLYLPWSGFNEIGTIRPATKLCLRTDVIISTGYSEDSSKSPHECNTKKQCESFENRVGPMMELLQIL
ncbi:hypothetical protein Hanom_Chr05g00445911 [Helianthus anomalus]